MKGCKFSTRCPAVIDACRAAQPPLDQAAGEAYVACIRWRELAGRPGPADATAEQTLRP